MDDRRIHVERSASDRPFGVGTSRWALDLLDSSNDAIVAVGESGRVLWFNPGAETMFGRAAADVVGGDLSALLPERFVASHQRHVEEFASGADQSRPMSSRAILVGRRSDGTEFPAAGSIVKMEGEHGLAMVAMLTDISERHEHAARADRLTMALDASRVGLLIVDNAGTVVETNEACILLVPDWLHSSPRGRSGADAFDALGLDWDAVRVEVTDQGGWETTIRLGDGPSIESQRYLRVSVTAESDRVVSEIGFVVTIVEVTDTARAIGSARRSAHLLEIAQKLAKLGAIELTHDLDVIRVSEQVVRVLGVGGAQSHVSLDELLAAFDPARSDVRAFLRSVVRTGRPEQRDFSVVGRTGARFHCQVWAELVRPDDRDPVLLVLLQDITSQQERLEAVLRGERQLLAVLNAMTARTVVLDRDGVVVRANEAWLTNERSCDLAAGVREGSNYLQAIRGAEGEAEIVSAGIEQVLAGSQRRFVVDCQCAGRRGCRHWAMIIAERIEGPDGGVVVSHRDITGRKRAEAELHHQATHDDLTGLANRVLVRDHIDRALAESDGHLLTVVMILDLDRFKLVNDSLGHRAGDRLLVALAQRLRTIMREHDEVGRLGGDEFVVVCSQVTDRRAVSGLADRILSTIRPPILIDGREFHLRASIGAAVAQGPIADADRLLQDADTAMYAAKAKGGQCYVVFDPQLGRQATRRLELEQDLRQSLQARQLELAYQPQFDLADGRLLGFEALCRWDHKRNGPVPPSDFIRIAEESDLIVDLGLWVLGEALAHIAGLDRVAPGNMLKVAVNVSPRQLLNGDFVKYVADSLERAGVHPSRLELELVESAIVDNTNQVADTLHQLREVGVGLALDDFGTGTASLSQLSVLPVSTVKIDRSFVESLTGQGDGSAVVVESIVAIASVRDLDVVAEGIETVMQLDALRQLGCRAGQGYLLGRPRVRKAGDALPVLSLTG